MPWATSCMPSVVASSWASPQRSPSQIFQCARPAQRVRWIFSGATHSATRAGSARSSSVSFVMPVSTSGPSMMDETDANSGRTSLMGVRRGTMPRVSSTTSPTSQPDSGVGTAKKVPLAGVCSLMLELRRRTRTALSLAAQPGTRTRRSRAGRGPGSRERNEESEMLTVSVAV